ncbi:rhodanese-like domain-containing protein [Hymenobacter cellulosivorans]|uniref:Rhodanese-like domain-containing protein n=1 Tax=Hymenobacter cellulosivorans TaxID=2932249 RepID=A0ABY4F4B7_9BACT|nr:rhodanese-like domain-containing protein [Hymenobacter cellulosivorans]UOQ51488.1 rhodanese-like domain-containing protein [Hymenobacter cellulosivorans]
MLRPAFSAAVLCALLSASAAFAQTTPAGGNTQPITTGQQTAPTSTAPSRPITSPAETQKLLKKRNVVVLDVRTPEEFATGHLQGAQNLNFRDPNFPTQLASLDTTKTYVLYCASGNRSGKAAGLMQEKGFRKLVNAGAFKDLKAAGVKTE